ncbi:MAG: hypothetical protein QM622_10695 [Microbacterium sp.]
MRTPPLTAPAIAQHIAGTFDGIFAIVGEWRATLAERLSVDGAPTAASLDPVVEGFAVPAIRGGGLATGAGFVAAPGLLSEAPWHLAWWLGDRNGARRLATVSDPTSDQFRDYTTLEWWRVPARTGKHHLTGPYVDYVCTDDYTVTLTTPVVVGGRMLGVVGVDALVARLELELLPVLRAGSGASVIVNASGRVVTATDAHREPGSILRIAGLAEALAPLRDDEPIMREALLPGGESVHLCGDTSLALVVGI